MRRAGALVGSVTLKSLSYDSSRPGAQWAVPEWTLFCVGMKSKQSALKAHQ